jgi:hypothetical protein
MPISLYEASVTSYLQVLGAVRGILVRGLEHCQQEGIDPSDLIETQLAPDMKPLRFQIQMVVHSSAAVIQAFGTGVFHPPHDLPNSDYAALRAAIDDAINTMEELTPGEINAREGAEVIFRTGGGDLRFSAEGFLLSFSLPNLHFHATTAYDILRALGVKLGKKDYLGALRTKH